ncbi:hypothetical protein [Rhizobium sp. M10]|uniref:hypothetical protein n=1 Tax=Rhizobium sp. M10 TaxID=1324586 RepID=UPI001AECC3B3|nr:hypothetical protein [Rhizobium sp. M10]
MSVSSPVSKTVDQQSAAKPRQLLPGRRPLLLLQTGDGDGADDPDDLLRGRGVCEEGGQSGNRHLDTLFQNVARNTVAFALHGADLKQYIFAIVRQWPMPARKQAMGCLNLSKVLQRPLRLREAALGRLMAGAGTRRESSRSLVAYDRGGI